jgi:mono/diheme cytochrome c family protein
MRVNGNIGAIEIKAQLIVRPLRPLHSVTNTLRRAFRNFRGVTYTAMLAASLAIISAQVRAADPPSDLERGRTLARTWCSQCHTVEPGDRQQRADGLASFSALANDPRNTPDRLRAFLTRPHGRMPDLNLSRQDRDDLVAYLVSMKEGAPPTGKAPSQQ